MKRRIWMPIDSTEQERFRNVEVVLAALRSASSLGMPQDNSPAARASMAALDVKDLTWDGPDLWEALRAWLGRRVEVIARELDPRLREDCLELRKLAFFTFYYLEPSASYPQICDLQPSSAMLLPNINALLHWWEQITRTSLSSLPPLPRHTQPAEKAIHDLLPVCSRTVGDNIRMAACCVFQIRVGRAPKINRSAEPKQANEDNHACDYERLQSAARLMARQWPVPMVNLMPAVDLAELVGSRRSLIIGPPGSGKTALLRRLMAALLECDRAGAVIVDLREPETWNHLDQPSTLAAHALSLLSTANDREHLLASGDMTLLLDHVEFLPEPALQPLAEAVRLLPSVYVAAPAWCATHFSSLPRFDVLPLNPNTIAALSGSAVTNVLDGGLMSTPLGLNIQSSLPLNDKVEAARYALLRLIEHANLGVASADVMAQAQRLAITLALQGADLRHTFNPSELQHRNTSERDFRFLLLTGLLITGTSGYRIEYPDLVLASVRRDWLPLVLGLAPSSDFAAVITAARLIALNEDNFAGAFLPELVGTVEQGLLPPDPVVAAILTLSGSTIFCHASLLRELIKRVDAAWQHKGPDDPRRQSCIRDAHFLLKRFAQPRIERPVEDVNMEVANLLAGAKANLDRELLWASVRVADASAYASVLELIDAYFDAHPDSQADLLIGCLKADTESGFDLFLALLRRPTFTCQASAGFIAAAFFDWIDHFSMSLLQAYVQTGEACPDDPARRFATLLWACLTAAPA